MSVARTFSWPSAAIAVVASIAVVFAGASPWIALVVALLWLGSLWLAAPEPEIATARIDAGEVSRDAARETIEPLGQPLLILDGRRILVANAAARAALGAHIVGQDARIALRHPEAMRLLDMENGASVSIAGFTGGRSLWQLTRRRVDRDRWMIEMIDRTAEADVSRAHTDFVANASHELRTPLAAIIGYVETLADGGPAVDEAATKRFLSVTEREAKRMLTLVEDLMTLSHVEAEKHDRPAELVDLSSLVRRVASEVNALTGKERVVLADVRSGAMIAGDSGQLEQVLRNLIDNAMKYGAPDEPVTVSLVEHDDARLVVTVADRGPGIAPEHLPHLTRRFYRTDPGRSRASGGTGLGLAIVKHIVERHDGQLEIASRLGEGTRVSVSLPAIAQADA
ncbi:two-component system phosphate regulon sensor histidine kinase PhoR [Novosphingobium kunmingense]|uniref:histidine kinase n=1 Tax=Novosphingobium kunmingense TaxID=1211806 RepID=A0A2N0I208_9SPHN|nr:ATP-binding protein [Novosphingobium kunmingense]PKB25190.1 two-component system phosphate regulon sensor histidine kinase PhoR [Novosphingobium kunmingense]